jgi:hypothetical protein
MTSAQSQVRRGQPGRRGLLHLGAAAAVLPSVAAAFPAQAQTANMPAGAPVPPLLREETG